MATTQSSVGYVDWGDGHVETAVDLSTIDPGASLNVSHGGPSGATVYKVSHEVTTLPTSKDVVHVAHVAASDSTTNNTARIVVDTTSGGDLTGAVVRVYFYFREAASGGIS